MTAKEAIVLFKDLLARCEPARLWRGDVLCLQSSATISFEDLRRLEDCGFNLRLQTEALNLAYNRGKNEHLASGSELRLEVPRQASKLAVVPSLGELLKCPGVATGRIKAYIICSDGVLEDYTDSEPDLRESVPDSVLLLHSSLRLWKTLEEWADYVQADGTLLYFGLRRITIEPGFSEADLPEVGNRISDIVSFKNTTDRSEVRQEIFKSVLADQLRDAPSSRAFAQLLKGTHTFARRLKESLAIYLSEHSPERLQKEAEKSALELSEKLESIISGLETKSLTVAPALLVAFKEALPGEGSVPLNLVTIGAALLYGVSMTWAHFSQKSLMEHVGHLADDCIRDIREQGLSEENRALKTVFPKLKARLRHAHWGAWAVCGLSWLPTLVVIWYAWFGTPVSAGDVKP